MNLSLRVGRGPWMVRSRRGASTALIIGAVVLVVVVLALTACSPPNSVGDQESAQWYQSKIVDSVAVASSQTSDSIDFYIDFSNGMGEGMRAARDVNLEIIFFLGGRKTRSYRVGASPDPVLITGRLGEGATDLLDLRNYSDKASFLRPPLDSILAHPERTALYITDFEKVLPGAPRQVAGAPKPHPFDVTAWGQDVFRAWLAAGNRIDVFAFPYDKPTAFGGAAVRNHIYYLVFTPRADAVDPKRFGNSLAQFLANRFQQVAGGGEHFIYWGEDIVRDAMPAGAQCRANQNLPVLECGAMRSATPAEWYWVTADALIGTEDDAAITDKRIVTLRLEPRLTFLQDGGTLGIRVTDVSAALGEVRRFLDDSAGAPPPDTNATTGAVQSNLPPTPTAMTLSPAVDAPNTFKVVYNATSHEVGILLDSAFDPPQSPVIYRIDIVLEAGQLADQSKADAVLVLNYANGYQIRSLGESLKFALRDIASNVSGRTLHTVYLRVDP